MLGNRLTDQFVIFARRGEKQADGSGSVVGGSTAAEKEEEKSFEVPDFLKNVNDDIFKIE